MKPNPSPIPHQELTKAGILPITKGPVRFAICSPEGLSSNSWKIWANSKGDLYIVCRDNFKEVKVSLHPGKKGDKSWRMAFTTEALQNRPNLVTDGENRAWEEWEEPKPFAPGAIMAFHLFFLNSELAVPEEKRKSKFWKNVIFIDKGPSGKMTVITVFIAEGNVDISIKDQPSFLLAKFPLNNDRFAHILAHADPEGNYPEFIERGVEASIRQAEEAGILIPDDGFIYLYGNRSIGSRFIIGARAKRK